MVPEGSATARGVIHTRPLLSLYARTRRRWRCRRAAAAV